MKRYYGLSAHEIVRRAPFSVINREWVGYSGHGHCLRDGWEVVDKSGDYVWSADITAQPKTYCIKVADELNLLAAKHFMESEARGKK